MNIQLSEHFTYKKITSFYPALHYYDGIHFHLQCGGRHLCIELCGKISICFRESHYALPDGNQCTWIYDRYRRKCFCIKNPW